MIVKNLTNSAMELGDGRMIGAFNERKYGKKELTERDQKRAEKGLLEIVEPISSNAGEATNSKKEKNK